MRSSLYKNIYENSLWTDTAFYQGVSSGATKRSNTAIENSPAYAIGTNASVSLPLKSPIMSPSEGEATLTPAQVADLLTGKWYVNIHTAAHPAGEIRGQMILRE